MSSSDNTKSAGKQLAPISIFFLPLCTLHLDQVALARFVRRLLLLRDNAFEASNSTLGKELLGVLEGF